MPPHEQAHRLLENMQLLRVHFHATDPLRESRRKHLVGHPKQLGASSWQNVLFASDPAVAGNPEEIMVEPTTVKSLDPGATVMRLNAAAVFNVIHELAAWLRDFSVELEDPERQERVAQWIFALVVALPSPPSLIEASQMAILRDFVRVLHTARTRFAPSSEKSAQKLVATCTLAIATVSIIFGQRDLGDPAWLQSVA